MPDGRPPEPGDVVAAAERTPRRCAGWSTPAAEGTTREDRIDAARREWGSGFVAQAVEAFVATPHRHSVGHRPRRGDHRGRPRRRSPATLRAARPRWTSAASRSRRPGAWGQGPVLLQALAILAGFEPHEIDPSTGAGAHRVLEALKLALADRDAYYGDPTARRTPVGAARRAALRGVRRRPARADRRAGVARVPARATSAGRPPYLPPLETAPEAGAAVAGAGEPTVVGQRPHPRRHLPPRRRRPLGQPGLGDPVGRLAAVVTDDPRARLLPGHPAADDLARRGARRRRCGPAAGRARR